MFSPEQQRYLAEFFSALAVDPAVPTATAVEPTVYGTALGDLSKPERWKYEEHPLDLWEKLVAHAESGRFPDEADTFRFKFHGLFYVAPTQDSFMVRLRIPAGEISAHQLHGVADMAADLGGGYVHITTRANLQIREIKPKHIVKVLVRLQELGLTSRGSGADNVRNITATPTSGFDPDELIDVRPFAKALHHYIHNHREFAGLPRKFNVAFDSGGSISVASDTNDIGLIACRYAGEPVFRVQLGGITGHKDFARDCGILVKPGECVSVAAAMIRVFNENGDRTDRKKARLKYLLEKWGVQKFLAETEARLAFPLTRIAPAACKWARPARKHGWLGAYRQAQRGLNYVGAAAPGGKLTAKQLHHVAEIALNYGQGELRLTVWQNFLIPHLPDAAVAGVVRALAKAGMSAEPSAATGGIVSCTGNTGCKYAAANTKAHAAAITKALESARTGLDSPINIHLTGCPHSCAQHYCGDIGLVGAKLPDGDEGYHLALGGGMGEEQGIGREVFRGVRGNSVPGLVVKIVRCFEAERQPGETFANWSRRHTVGQLQEKFS